MMENVSLYKFTHIPLLKNDSQLKQKSDKKKQLPNLLKNKNQVKKNHVQLNKEKKKKKKQATYSQKRKLKKKKKMELDELPMCKCTWTFLSIK